VPLIVALRRATGAADADGEGIRLDAETVVLVAWPAVHFLGGCLEKRRHVCPLAIPWIAPWESPFFSHRIVEG